MKLLASAELKKEDDVVKAYHILRRVSIPESFLFFTDTSHYTGEFAPSLSVFLHEIEKVPSESIEFHFERGDFKRWIQNTLEDDELASRISEIDEQIAKENLVETVQKILRERIEQLSEKMWSAQRQAMVLEKRNFFGHKMVFAIDLTKIKGEGEIMCPRCRVIISPNEPSGIDYEVLHSTSAEDGSMIDSFIQCCKCGSVMRLYGFEVLHNLPEETDQSS